MLNAKTLAAVFLVIDPQERLNIFSATIDGNSNNTILHLIAGSEHLKAYRNIIQSLFSSLDDMCYGVLNKENVAKQTPVHLSAKTRNNVGVFLKTLSPKQRKEILLKGDNHGQTPVHLALKSKTETVLSEILASLPNSESKLSVLSQTD